MHKIGSCCLSRMVSSLEEEKSLAIRLVKALLKGGGKGGGKDENNNNEVRLDTITVALL